MTGTEKQSGVCFDDATHTYMVDDNVLPSVTQVLNAAGLVDGRWFNEGARDRGRIVAIAIELHSKNNLQSVPDGYQAYVDAWQRFLDETGFVPREVETPRYNNILGYAGTPDADGEMPWKTIIDVKTGCDAPHYAIQTAGYAGLFPGRRDRLCVFLSDTGRYKIREHNNPRDRDVFLAALKCTHWQRKHLK